MMIESTGQKVLKVLLYVFLIITAAIMLLPFLWMLSASLKQDRDVFTFPIQWIPAEPEWANYSRIWTQIPLLTYILNTVKLTIIVTLLQLFTSSFAAYAFSKLRFKGRNALFLGYIATIAVPWQAYMVPQFMMLRSMGLNNTHLAIIILQAFSAFGVFMMKQFYEGVPTELCEAARIDGMTEYGIYARIMLPLAKPALSTLTIFTFVNTGTEKLHRTVFVGIRPDHGGQRGDHDPRHSRVPCIAEVLRRRSRLQRPQGLRIGASQCNREDGQVPSSLFALRPLAPVRRDIYDYLISRI